MSPATDPWVALMEGDAALPRSNGELIFESPWQGRAFGMAVSLVEQGGHDWEEFRQLLIAQIAKGVSGPEQPEYYKQWLAALEELVISKHLTTKDELDLRTEELGDSRGEQWDW